MPDDNEDLGLGQYGLGTLGNIGSNSIMQAALAQAMQNLKDRFGDYDKLQTPNFKSLAPERLGPSALGNIKNDAQSRIDQQAAQAALQNLADRGGLNLADHAALNTQEQTLSRNNAARQNSLKNQFAARGQLGSGAELAMDLANNQNAAQNANQHGEQIAGEAQKRAMQAVLEKAGLARNMSNDQYGRDRASAEANDAINRYNSSMSMEAQRGNNQYLQEGYGDQMQKLQAKSGLTNSLNNAVLGSGRQNANTLLNQSRLGNGFLSGLGRGKAGGGGSTDPNSPNYDPGLDQSGQADISGNRGGAGDLSGGATDVSDTGIDPSELENPYGDF